MIIRLDMMICVHVKSFEKLKMERENNQGKNDI